MVATLYYPATAPSTFVAAYKAGILGTKLNAYQADVKTKTIATGPLAGQDLQVINPKRTVPVLILESGIMLNESSAVFQWMVDQAVNPIGPKVGSDASFAASEIISTLNDLVHAKISEGARNYLTEKLKIKLQYLNDHELKGKKKYWVGNELTVADIHLYSLLQGISTRLQWSFGANTKAYFEGLKKSGFNKQALEFLAKHPEISVGDKIVSLSPEIDDSVGTPTAERKSFFRTSSNHSSLSDTKYGNLLPYSAFSICSTIPKAIPNTSSNSNKSQESLTYSDHSSTKPIATLYYATTSSGVANVIAAHRAGILGTKLAAHQVSLSKKKVLTGPNTGSDYLTINPKGNVPAIVLHENKPQTTDNTILFENAATLQWIMDHAASPVGPAPGTDEMYLVQSKLSFISSEIHSLLTDLFSPNSSTDARKYLSEKLKEKMQYANDVEFADSSGGVKYWVGDAYSVVDAYGAFIFATAEFVGIQLSSFPNLKKYVDGINELNFVQEANDIISDQTP
ncbi:hypothetical protein HK100_006384 [Physocladia obscura]|uniref:GST C-terminal domain-containing protein n=1 Tax=Physocladia obscura TaxID=109957 RepID=A0AAD5SQI5_9FUNG|nr:hypothetical protein HK100_006384 [Physocladia obscura]